MLEAGVENSFKYGLINLFRVRVKIAPNNYRHKVGNNKYHKRGMHEVPVT